MKTKKKYWFSWGIPVILIFIIALFRIQPAWTEAYARNVYPGISAFLSAFSSGFPFSLGDCFIVGACLWIVVYPFYAWKKKKKGSTTLGIIVRFLMWVYIWFYFAWGLNYFRYNFYERAGVVQVPFDKEEFLQFLNGYSERLNESYAWTGDTLSDELLHPYPGSAYIERFPVTESIKEAYGQLASRFGLVSPNKSLRAKPMLWSGGMSRMGVTGYMGPFFAEFNLNQELLNVEYPFTYAHELAHRLGVAGEAEANFYAYLVTTGNPQPLIRFSGYFSMLGYVMGNARQLLDREEYQEILKQIRPEIIDLYNRHLEYWRQKYHSGLGQLQNKVYNAYLKGNQVSSGTKNYSEVIGLLISFQRTEPFPV